jgi:hypothetical protein
MITSRASSILGSGTISQQCSDALCRAPLKPMPPAVPNLPRRHGSSHYSKGHMHESSLLERQERHTIVDAAAHPLVPEIRDRSEQFANDAACQRPRIGSVDPGRSDVGEACHRTKTHEETACS